GAHTAVPDLHTRALLPLRSGGRHPLPHLPPARRLPGGPSRDAGCHEGHAVSVARGVPLADRKGTLAAVARELFGQDVTVRFRPDYFPFVEPGVEIAVKLPHRWMELGGAGIIHPNVLRHVGIDPEEWSGYAFGLGLDRMPMVRYGIDRIRL